MLRWEGKSNREGLRNAGFIKVGGAGKTLSKSDIGKKCPDGLG